jgi:hypothetical protein
VRSVTLIALIMIVRGLRTLLFGLAAMIVVGADVTGRICDRLIQRYGKDCVFRDIDSIPFGIDFQQVKDADVLIAVVGPNWRGDKDGKARIDEENDLVPIEVETAVQKAIPVIPVLVGGALMPQPDERPKPLRDFSFRNGATINSGWNFDNDVERLIYSMDVLFESNGISAKAVDQSAAKPFSASPTLSEQPVERLEPTRPAAFAGRDQTPGVSSDGG